VRLQLLRHSTLRCARLERQAGSSAESAPRLLPDRSSLARLAADCRAHMRSGAYKILFEMVTGST
jgi:hypothetical protein